MEDLIRVFESEMFCHNPKCRWHIPSKCGDFLRYVDPSVAVPLKIPSGEVCCKEAAVKIVTRKEVVINGGSRILLCDECR